MKVFATVICLLLFVSPAYGRLSAPKNETETIEKVVEEATDHLKDPSLSNRVLTSGIGQIIESVGQENSPTGVKPLVSLLKPVMQKEHTTDIIKKTIEEESRAHPQMFKKVMEIESDLNASAAEKAESEVEVARQVMVQMQEDGTLPPVVKIIKDNLVKQLPASTKPEPVNDEELTEDIVKVIEKPITTEQLVADFREANQAATALVQEGKGKKIGEVESEKP